MTHLAWTATVFRILSVWLLCEVLIGVPGTLGGILQLSRVDPPQPVRAFIVPAIWGWITSSIIIAALWKWSGRLAELVWRDRTGPSIPSTLEPRAVQQAVFVGFGIYLLVYGLPNVTELAAGYYTLPTGFGLETSFSGQLWGRAIGVFIQIVAGAALIVASGTLARWLTRAPGSGPK